MSVLRKSTVVLVIFLLMFLVPGCANEEGNGANNGNGGNGGGQVEQNETEEANAALRELLPEKEGYHWVYNGFAEYGHSMDLERIENQDGQTTYFISGEVADMSGGESDRDFSLEMEYVIEDGVLTQKKKEELMLDSISNEIQLLKTPLEQGASWKQVIIDKEGNRFDMDCRITEVTEENGIKEYTVIYEDQESDYFERRKIREGVGIVSLEKMLDTGEESFIAGYALYEEASGYNK